MSDEEDKRAAGPGRDVVFSLPNPKWKVAGLGVFMAAISAFPYLVEDDSPRLAFLRVVAPIVGAILGAFAYDTLINKHHVAPEANR